MYTAMWLSCVGGVGFTMCCAMPVALALSSWNQGSGRLYGVCYDGMIEAGRLQGGNSGQIFIRGWACIWSHRLRPRRLNHRPGLHLLIFGVDRPTCESAGIRVLLMYEFGMAVGDKTIRP
jgi:hypothetical protein